MYYLSYFHFVAALKTAWFRAVVNHSDEVFLRRHHVQFISALGENEAGMAKPQVSKSHAVGVWLFQVCRRAGGWLDVGGWVWVGGRGSWL